METARRLPHFLPAVAIAMHGIALLLYPRETMKDVYGVAIVDDMLKSTASEHALVVFSLNRLACIQLALGLLLASRWGEKSIVAPLYLLSYALVLFAGPSPDLQVDNVVAGCCTLAVLALSSPAAATAPPMAPPGQRFDVMQDTMRKLLSVLALGFEVGSVFG